MKHDEFIIERAKSILWDAVKYIERNRSVYPFQVTTALAMHNYKELLIRLDKES